MRRGELGRLGEDFAAGLLTAEGYRVIERNFRCRAGEIDIIAEKNGELSFVEVKTRRTLTFGQPAEAVTLEKQRRLRETAAYYIHTHTVCCRTIRFQIVEVFCNQIYNAF